METDSEAGVCDHEAITQDYGSGYMNVALGTNCYRGEWNDIFAEWGLISGQ